MTEKQLEEGWYWVRWLDRYDGPHEWQPGEVCMAYGAPIQVVALCGRGMEHLVEKFEIGPRLTPPQE